MAGNPASRALEIGDPFQHKAIQRFCLFMIFFIKDKVSSKIYIGFLWGEDSQSPISLNSVIAAWRAYR